MLLMKYGTRTDVVFVAVRQQETFDLAQPAGEHVEVGKHQVDAELLRRRELDAAVDDDDPVAQLDEIHVLADLPRPADGGCAQRAGGRHEARTRMSCASSRAASAPRFLGRCLDERQPDPGGRDRADHLHRGLDQDRARGREQALVQSVQGGIEPLRLCAVAGSAGGAHRLHLGTDEMRRGPR